MNVWIDQDLCTGDAQCVEICPEIFVLHDDGESCRSYVRDVGTSGFAPDGEPVLRAAQGRARVPREFRAAVAEAADYCPGACIFTDGE